MHLILSACFGRIGLIISNWRAYGEITPTFQHLGLKISYAVPRLRYAAGLLD